MLTVSQPVGGIQLRVRHVHRPTSYNLVTWFFVFAVYLIPDDGRRTWVLNGSRHYPRHMTNEERIRGVEDAVILLTHVLEEKTGPFVRDVNPTVSGSGALIHLWMASVKAHRADEQA
jgi:hypothetical protein